MKRSRGAALALVLAIGLFSCAAPALPSTASSPQPRDAGSAEQIVAHLDALMAIAREHDGTRAAGTPGFDASVEYVADQLASAGLSVSRNELDLPFFSEMEPVRLTVNGIEWVGGDWLHALLYSATGTVSGPLRSVGIGAGGSPEDTAGCAPDDWSAVTPGDIALVVSGGPCFRRVQVEHAQEAGAAAVIALYPAWERGEIRRPTLLRPDGISIPVIAAGREPAQALLEAVNGEAQAELDVQVRVEDRRTANLVAELPGRGNEVVVLGAHLDSVLDGPGINDNGSGVAALIELARALADGPPPERTVRFAFWSAEEFGLVGSTAYVEGMAPAELARIVAYLNADMLGSPNPGRYVYDEADAAPGSTALTELLLDYLAASGTPGVAVDLHGSSDHGPFQHAGIPTGGVYSGAAEPMPAADAATFGASAGAPMDPCYHLACDTEETIDPVTLEVLADALGHALAELASGRLELSDS